jgi:hypothetical protein
MSTKQYNTSQDVRNAVAKFNIENSSNFLMNDLYKAILKTQKIKYDSEGQPIRGVSRSYVSSGLKAQSNLLDLQINEALEHLKSLL